MGATEASGAEYGGGVQLPLEPPFAAPLVPVPLAPAEVQAASNPAHAAREATPRVLRSIEVRTEGSSRNMRGARFCGPKQKADLESARGPPSQSNSGGALQLLAQGARAGNSLGLSTRFNAIISR
jgi:hypothetical protein